MKYNRISEKSEKYIFVTIVFFSLLVLSILFIINFLLGKMLDNKYCYIVYALILLDIVITMILIYFLPKIIYKNFGYYIDQEKLEAKSGIIFINRKIVLLKNVYKIVIKKKIIGRIFGISSLTLVTSAGDIKVHFLDEKALDKLYNKVLNKIHEEML